MAEQGPLSNRVLGGRYLLGDLLGEGGFGAVYQAVNRPLNRPQAIKVLLEKHLRDPKFHQRFIREAQTLAALDHPHIVHVDELGEEPDLIYLVMPYVSGGTLQGLLQAQSGPLGLEQVTRYLEQVCSALDYAHGQGIAHLDLKPLNLLVHQDGRLLLSDFGLAHLMEQGAIEGGTSLQFGSPLYMAPEQFDGKPTQQSDLYALGVLLYQILAGRHPFEASTPAAIMRKHLTEPPPPLHLTRPDLPVALDAVLGKALAKQEEQRYGRAGELLFDFRAALAGQAAQFSSSADPTQRAQVYLDPTIYAVRPPVSPASATLHEAEPVTPEHIGKPIAPQKPPSAFLSPAKPRLVSADAPAVPGALRKGNLWTPGFTLLFIGMALLGGIIMVVANAVIANDFFGIDWAFVTAFGREDAHFSGPLGGGYFVASDWIAMLLLGVVLSVYLVGLRFVSFKPLRTGLLLQIGALATNLVLFALFLSLDATDHDSTFYNSLPYSLLQAYLPLILTVLNAVSVVVISLGIARWQQAQDTWLTVLQVIGSGVAAYLLLNALSSTTNIVVGEGVSPLLFWFAVAVTLFAASVFLLRPACWKQQPIVTFLLALGTILFVPQAPGGFLLMERWAGGDYLKYPHALYSVPLLSWVLLLLGFLLLIQIERVRKRAQQVEADPVLAGHQP